MMKLLIIQRIKVKLRYVTQWVKKQLKQWIQKTPILMSINPN